MRPGRRSEQGVALLATLMAVALMTVLVIDFTSSASLGYRSAANQANELRAYYLARSGVQVGLALLAQDARKDATMQQQGQSYDGLDEPWAKVKYNPPLPVGGGFASVEIVDEESKLPINLLVDPNSSQVNLVLQNLFTQLFQSVGVSPAVLPAIEDWLDRDSIPKDGGAEADYYLHLIPPYEPRNGPMPTIGDLRMIRGIDDVTFMRLSRFLTVVNTSQQSSGASGGAQGGATGTALGALLQVNINTAPPEVLAALTATFANDSSGELAKSIIAERVEQPFTETELQTRLSYFGSSAASLQSIFTTNSGYFTITGRGTYAGSRKLVFAIVNRVAVTQEGAVQMSLLGWNED